MDTSPLKESLSIKASGLVESLLAQLLQKSVDTYTHVCTRCEAMSKAVMVVAEDGKQLLELQVWGGGGGGGKGACSSWRSCVHVWGGEGGIKQQVEVRRCCLEGRVQDRKSVV